MTVGAAEPSVTVFELYWNPVSVWSPLATDRERDQHRGRRCPPASVTVTVALAVLAFGRVRRAADHTRSNGVDAQPQRQPRGAVLGDAAAARWGSPHSIATPTCGEPGAV